jgi:hypothetical protein
MHAMSHYFKSKLNICQLGVTKSKSTVTNLVTYLDFVTPLVCSQREADADLRSAFHIVPDSLFLNKLVDCGLFVDSVNLFSSYLTVKRLSHVRYSGALQRLFKH